MKILICSDSHTRLDYFDRVMKEESPELVIFAGDHSTDAIEMSYVFDKIPFVIVRGNTDFYDQDTKDREILEVNDEKILITHGHLQGVKQNLNNLEKEAMELGVDICIFGHTHKEFHMKKNEIIYINPGALQDRKYIIYDGKDFEQKYF